MGDISEVPECLPNTAASTRARRSYIFSSISSLTHCQRQVKQHPSIRLPHKTPVKPFMHVNDEHTTPQEMDIICLSIIDLFFLDPTALWKAC